MKPLPQTSPIRNQSYPILKNYEPNNYAINSANMYNICIEPEKPQQSWRSYKHDDVGHYATLPKVSAKQYQK